MALTRYEIGRRAIAYLTSAVPSTAQFQWVLSDINGALTEIAHEAPSGLFSARRATGRLGSSTALQVTATQDSEILTLNSPASWQDRMLGCAVLVAGDPRVNRIEQLVLTYATGTITFSAPPTENDTTQIDAITYRWKASPVQASDVEIGGDATVSRDNLLAAMRVTSLESIPYFVSGTAAHPTVTGAPSGTLSITLTALTGGTVGNVTLAESSTAMTVSDSELSGGAAEQVRLIFPFAGTTGSPTITVYYESWPLRSDELDASGPVLFETLDDGTRNRLTAFSGRWEEWQEQEQASSQLITGATTPQFYRVESNQSYLGTGTSRRFTTPTKWLRLSRWPSESGSVSYTARLYPPQFALTDITLDQGNGRLYSGLPEGWDDMVLLPIILWRMLAWLSFPTTVQSAQESIRTGIHEKYKRALAFLRAQTAQTETSNEMSVG